jgi:two-component system LytT family response regulator
MSEKKYLNAIIVDDEFKAIENLKKLIDTYCHNIKIISTAIGAESAVILINDLKPDVVFLDISMPKKSGFELLNVLNFMPLIVFVTAHEKYAINAIKASAVDFLLKPVDINELQLVEEKLLYIQGIRERKLNENYSTVVGNLVNMIRYPGIIKQITLPDTQGYNIVNIEDVLYLEGENNYTFFHLHKKQKVVVAKTLKEYEDLLTESDFFRIHKSSIINLHHLRKVTTENGINAIMSDDHVLPVSRRRAADLIDKAKQFLH